MAIEESEIQEQAEAEALHGDEGGAAVEPVPHPLRERVEELGKLKEAALHAGSPAAIERQHARGKLTARERL
ncbi:MAG TPA: methylmalonyl-CoA carboxyltransferase, partial [Acidimicrobiia bacterium]|nr:methylmalonyl-CoA carboxyltransferase [Acidimicrobiia bacterium]